MILSLGGAVLLWIAPSPFLLMMRFLFPPRWYVFFQWLLVFLTTGCTVPSTGVATLEPTPVAKQSETPYPVVSHLTPTPKPTPVARVPLVVFCAGSLILPFAELEAAFEAQNPDVDVLNECHGSIQVIRHVTELHEPIDVVATADAALIPMLMYVSLEPDSGLPYASWYIRFAGNRLTLAYTPGSRYAGEISAENWFEIINRPDVRLGLADPRFDASGYRALMALKLAEPVYVVPGLLNRTIKDQFRYPITVFEEEGYTEITVPEIVEPAPQSHLVIRGASIQLIALLESGDLDYAYEYESVIRQHGLQMISLPEAVNLGSLDLADLYRQVQVKLDFQRFASLKPVFRGEPIGYGLTIPVNAPHPDEAARFIAFILSPDGRRILQANYQPVLEPLACDGAEQMPSALRNLCQVGISP